MNLNEEPYVPYTTIKQFSLAYFVFSISNNYKQLKLVYKWRFVTTASWVEVISSILPTFFRVIIIIV